MTTNMSKIEQVTNELRKARLQHADDRLRWLNERAALLKVIFQLSEALEWEKRH